MALGGVNVTKQQGAGQPINGKDHYSGMVFYVDQASEYPAGILALYSSGVKVVGAYLEHTDHVIYNDGYVDLR